MAKILVADDNSNIQKMVGLALKDQGIDVVAVGNGEAAVRKISDIRPDLVLADVFMPVRNGYEVCEYVKQDPSLAHIPVILLVGAFDPLDEQEAQRVGADGVLKKPFVPPDPLISMVKSALARAGVTVVSPEEAAKAAKKAAETPPPPAQMPTPPPPMPHVEEFPEMESDVVTARPTVKFGAGDQPLAFGNLLETPGAQGEDDAAFIPPAGSGLATERDWRTEDVDEEEEEEAEGAKGSWRRDGGDESLEDAIPAGGKPDWREAAFAEKPAPENSEPLLWTPAPEKPQVAEVAAVEEHAASVVTEEKTPAPAAPFAGDAWAAAISSVTESKLAAGSEEKPVEIVEASHTEVAEVSSDKEIPASGQFVVQSATTAATVPEVESPKHSGGWGATASSPWETEAQKATQLAATWDAPAVLAPVVVHEELKASSESESASAYSHDAAIEHALHASDAPATAVVPETSLSQATVEAIREEATHVVESAPAASLVAEASAEISKGVEPSLDDLVAKVLAKMSPEILQAVTREILRPVIEAVVREEIKPKKP